MIEKLGHSKRLKVMRQEWISEARIQKYNTDTSDLPKEIADGLLDSNGSNQATINSTHKGEEAPNGDKNQEESLFVGGESSSTKVNDHDDHDDLDDLDALLAEEPEILGTASSNQQKPQRGDTKEPPDTAFDEKYAQEIELLAEMDDW
jgi:hypothetical protein